MAEAVDEIKVKHATALQMKRAGVPLNDIAIALGYDNPGSVRYAIQQAEKRERNGEIIDGNPNMPGYEPAVPRDRGLSVEEKQARAFSLRKRGHSFRSIAKLLGYASESSAHDAYRSYLAKLPKHLLEEAKVVDLERLEDLWRVAWSKAKAGDQKAVSNCISILERRAKVHGIDANPDSGRSGPVTNNILLNLQKMSTPELVGVLEALQARRLGSGEPVIDAEEVRHEQPAELPS